MKYDIEARAHKDGSIEQTIVAQHDNIRTEILRQVIHTQDEQVRAALIGLGWSPPGRTQNWIDLDAEPSACDPMGQNKIRVHACEVREMRRKLAKIKDII